MKSGRLRLSWLTALTAAAGATLTILIALWTGSAPTGFAVALLLSLGAGLLAGRPLQRSVLRLRASLLQRARSDAGRAGPEFAFRELVELANAADLLALELTRRGERLEQQRSHLATLVESVGEGLLRVGASGRIEYLNPAARALLGLQADAEGQPIAVLVRSHELRQLLDRALRGERIQGAEIALGEKRILVSAQPLGGTGDGAGAGVALADLTTLRRLEGVRRDFVANVSHELKTPLTSIRGYAETLLGDDPPPEIRRQFLETVQRNAARLQNIVDELLDLSMIESGAWQPQLQDVGIGELVADVWASCRERAPDITFQAPDTEVRVRADAGALRQILGNLLDNAIRYTPADGRIAVTAAPSARSPGTIQVEVADTGMGIPREALPRIFERFYRVDPARSRAAGGTGLGLAIVKHMVENMGGEVTAESDLGKGTVIRFTLPAA